MGANANLPAQAPPPARSAGDESGSKAVVRDLEPRRVEALRSTLLLLMDACAYAGAAARPPSPSWPQAGVDLGPGNYSQSAARVQMELLHQLGRFHGDGHTSSVVDRTRSQVPGIEMPRDHNDLFQALVGSFQVGNDVMRDYVFTG